MHDDAGTHVARSVQEIVFTGARLPGPAMDRSRFYELFDRAWYGDEPTGAAENQSFRALADEVVLGVEAGAAADAPVGAGSFEAPT